MPHILIRHKVRDFATWKPVYEDHRPAREAASLRDLHLWQNADDPTEVVILFEAADADRAKEFATSPDLKAKMEEAGVVGAPDIVFLADA
ncbi:MAG: cyclase [Acidiferrobacterales bacterium]